MACATIQSVIGRMPNNDSLRPRLLLSGALRQVSCGLHCIGSTMLALTLVLAGPILVIVGIHRALEAAFGRSVIPGWHPKHAESLLVTFLALAALTSVAAALLATSWGLNAARRRLCPSPSGPNSPRPPQRRSGGTFPAQARVLLVPFTSGSLTPAPPSRQTASPRVRGGSAGRLLTGRAEV